MTVHDVQCTQVATISGHHLPFQLGIWQRSSFNHENSGADSASALRIPHAYYAHLTYLDPGLAIKSWTPMLTYGAHEAQVLCLSRSLHIDRSAHWQRSHTRLAIASSSIQKKAH